LETTPSLLLVIRGLSHHTACLRDTGVADAALSP
jgi:hypothetical protein